MEDIHLNCTSSFSKDSGDIATEEREKVKSFARNVMCLDYSHQSLTEIPSLKNLESSHVQFLYLQNNFIKVLPRDFFTSFFSLRHLDLRQNQLIEIPSSIAGHCNLETLLLQDNQLTRLPYELGQVPRLRKLQFSGNALTWPPEKILAEGLNSILSFLRTAFMQKLSEGDADEVHGKNKHGDVETCSQSPNFQRSDLEVKVLASQNISMTCDRPHYSKSSSLIKACENDSERLKDQLKKNQGIVLLRGSSKQLKSRIDMHTEPRILQSSLRPHMSHHAAYVVINGQTFPLGYRKRSSSLSTTKIYKTLMQQLWLNQLKCVRQSQDHDLQRKKTWEALSQWRQEAKSLQGSCSERTWSGLEAPFDLHSEYLMMATRASLLAGKNESLEKRGHSKPKESSVAAFNLQEKIQQILKSFDDLRSDPKHSSSNISDINPSTRLKLLADEMQKIRKLQKSVQALRLTT